jgi:shikimate kinase
MSTRVLLVGMMACGKSTVGRALSEQTGWPYVDNDELVAVLAGQATPDVAATRGVDGLHMLEGFVVEEILGTEPPLVAGIPGSSVTTESTRAQLRANGYVVWLRARLETLAARVGDGSSRPFFAGHDVLATLERLNEGREPMYAAAAHLVIDVDDLDAETIAALIEDALPRA